MALGSEIKRLATVLILGTFALNIASFFREFLNSLLWIVLPMSESGTKTKFQDMLFKALLFLFTLCIFFAFAIAVL